MEIAEQLSGIVIWLHLVDHYYWEVRLCQKVVFRNNGSIELLESSGSVTVSSSRCDDFPRFNRKSKLLCHQINIIIKSTVTFLNTHCITMTTMGLYITMLNIIILNNGHILPIKHTHTHCTFSLIFSFLIILVYLL